MRTVLLERGLKLKQCEYCSESFSVSKSGSGGSNRRLCYSCLPNGLSKKERGEVRYSLLAKKNYEYKLSLGCTLCGYSKLAQALEWHHPEDDKLYEPSNLLKSSWLRYLEEASKCILLCSNCHREVHAGLTVIL